MKGQLASNAKLTDQQRKELAVTIETKQKALQRNYEDLQTEMQRTEQESEYGEHYRVSLDDMLIIYDTLVLGLELPATVNAAINRKIEQYYLVQEYGFRVEREKKESERKQIEANGIRDFQQTVTQGISDSYVRWRGIEATLQLAQSPNSKIVIIGSGKDGLPVILGNVDTPMQPTPAAPAVPPGAGTQPDNSEAARQPPSAASPPLLEKTPASNLQSPSERPSPTAVPRAPGAPGDGRASWTWSEIQDLISRTVGAGPPPPDARPPPPEGPGHGPGGQPGPGPHPAGPPSPQAEGPKPPPMPERGPPRPPEQPR